MAEQALGSEYFEALTHPSFDADNKNTKTEEDRVLLQCVKSPCEETSTQALLCVYEKYHRYVLRFVGSKVSNADDVEDIAQETWQVAFQKIFTFEWRDIALKSWLTGIALNKCLEFLRRNESHSCLDESMTLPQTAVFSPIDRQEVPGARHDEKASAPFSDRQKANREVQEAIQTLPELQRKIIELKYFEEIETFREVAELLGQKRSTVRVNHMRAVQKLRKFPLLQQRIGQAK